MALSEEQIMALMGGLVRIVDPPVDRPDLLNKIGRVAMVADGENCVLQLEDGSAVSITADRLQPAG